MDKLNKLLTDLDYDCHLSIRLNFVGLLKGTLSVKSVIVANKEWSAAVESDTIEGVLEALNAMLDN